MRIIKKGKIPPEKEIEQTCPDCTTVFAFKQKDIECYERDYDYEVKYVTCPLCKKQLDPNKK